MTINFGVRNAFIRLLCALAIFTAGAERAGAGEPKFPALTGRVVDESGILSATTEERITGWLQQFEAATKRQVVVVTVKSLQGYPVEDFGYRLGRFWGIGEKERDTGAILLVAPNEREVRIEVGYGLEGELTDSISRVIIERDILPAFRQGNFDLGITAGTASMLRALGWNGATGASGVVPVTEDNASPLWFILIVVVFILWRTSRRGGWISPGSGGIWRSRSGSGGGGFRGGGGSFGGGGASGRW